MRNRKQSLSNGFGQFAQALRKQANISREFIVNDKIWQLVSSPQSDSDDEEETQQSDSEKANKKLCNRSPRRKLRKMFVVFYGIAQSKH